jgi:hypothetical protein
MDDPQELLNTARHHCQAIQAIIDQLTETKSNTELRLLSQRLQRLAFHAAPRRNEESRGTSQLNREAEEGRDKKKRR